MIYYNEWDQPTAAWLRELIAQGHLPAGDVDTRSITEVQPDDLRGYTSCHFFAGIGGWPYALRLAGWPDDRPVWSGSCPCQPLSSAGQRKGHADERHLWPAFFRLIAECRPATVFGEQVAGKDGREWLAGVRLDLESAGYACGAADLCAAGVGAPHIRQRLYWLANSARERRGETRGDCRRSSERIAGGSFEDQSMANANSRASGRDGRGFFEAQRSAQQESDAERSCACGALSGADVGHAPSARLQGQRSFDSACGQGSRGQLGPTSQACGAEWNGATRLVDCTDGPRRISAEPRAFPVADGLPARVVRLRGYGNAIVPQVAAQFVAAAMEAVDAP